MSLPKEYIERIRNLRAAKRLHGYVEAELIKTLKSVAPDLHPIAEPQGLAGGRNDLLLFEFTGEKVLFEIFATKSQVSRDLRILDKTDAEIKIAIIIDKDVDGKVFEQFHRENPEDNYPFVFMYELLGPGPLGKAKLWELIKKDEEARFRRLLAQRVAATSPLATLKDAGADILRGEDLAQEQVTLKKVIVTCVLKKLIEMGMKPTALKSFAKWFSRDDLHKYLIMKLSYGFNTYLYTDLVENFDILSDCELLDWLLAGHQFQEPYILLSMNATVFEVIDTYLPKLSDSFTRDIRVTISWAQVIEQKDGRIVAFSIPKNTKKIYLIPPMSENGEGSDSMSSEEEYGEMIEFVPKGTLLAFGV